MRRWKKYALIATALCVFAAIGYWLWDRVAYSGSWARLEAYKSALDKSDPGWRLEEILAERNASFPPDDENPLVVTEQVFALLPPIFHDWARNPTGKAGFQSWLPEIELNRLPPTEYSDRASCVAYESREAIEKARSLRFFQKDGGCVLEFPDEPSYTQRRPTLKVVHISGLLGMDSAISAIQGDGNRAVESVRAGLHTTKAVVREPFLYSGMIRTGEIRSAIANLKRTLALTEPTQGLEELQAEIAAEIRVPGHTLMLKGERANYNRKFENINNGKLDLEGILQDEIHVKTRKSVTKVDPIFLWQYKDRIPAEHLMMLKTMTQCIENSKKPLHQQLVLFSQMEAPDSRYLIIQLLMYYMKQGLQHECRAQTEMRCAVVAIGCERFRQKNQRWPADLGELGTEFLPEGIPIDPYTGQPLRYRRYSGGVVIYSPGLDGKDNDGNLSAKDDPGTDVGFRLWDPDRRAMEPLSEKASP